MPVEIRIRLIRGQRIILDADLAALYGVTTKNINKAVKRNRTRFPNDFMFRLTEAEFAALTQERREEPHILRFQIGTSSFPLHGGRRHRPYAFTKQGAAGLSGVLRSPRAASKSALK